MRAGATPAVFSPRVSGEKWGRSSPLRCFARVQNQPSRETQLPCSVQLSFTAEVNGALNRRVNRVFHAPFTFPRQEKLLNLRPSTNTEASETKNVKDKSRPAPGRSRASMVFDLCFRGNPEIFGPPLHSKQLPNPPPRIRARNCFTRLLGDINVNSPYILRGFEKGKPQLESLHFVRKVCGALREPQ